MTTTSSLVAPILIAVLCSGKDKKTAGISSLLLKPTSNLELSVNQFNNATPELTDFNSNYLNKLLDNISKEQKSIFLLEDFNANLLNYNKHNPTNEFLDSLASNSSAPLILQPTRITSHSNTLIDNIFLNIIDPNII